MFSTKRLGLLFAALLVATMSLGIITSGAWFTDTDSVAVTATSGEIEVVWNGPNSNGFSVSDLMPQNGFANSPKHALEIYNTGTSTSAVKFRVTDLLTSESVAGFYAQLYVHVEEIDCGATSVVRVAYSGLLQDLEFTSIGAKYDPLPVNFTDCYTFQFALSQFAGNEFQNQTAAFDLVLDATQPENPGWGE
jgi:hypothetical protein